MTFKWICGSQTPSKLGAALEKAYWRTFLHTKNHSISSEVIFIMSITYIMSTRVIQALQ